MLEIEKNPDDIEKLSHKIIRERLPNTFRNEEEYGIAVRVAQATGDIDFARELKFHQDFIKSALNSIRSGLPILVDVEMAKAGISNYAKSLGIDVICAINDPEVIEMAKKLGITRSIAAVRKVLGEKKVGLVVCGNSPTFLYEVINFCENKKESKPLALIGLPVGFVSALEVKKYLYETQIIPFLTNLSTKGGTPAAVSSAIYLLNLERKQKSYGQHS